MLLMVESFQRDLGFDDKRPLPQVYSNSEKLYLPIAFQADGGMLGLIERLLA